MTTDRRSEAAVALARKVGLIVVGGVAFHLAILLAVLAAPLVWLTGLAMDAAEWAFARDEVDP